MDRFVDDVMALLNVRYQGGYIVFDTCICNNKYSVLIIERIFIGLLQWVLNVSMSLWLTEVKENWSEKVSIEQKPGESFLFRESKEKRTSF